MPDHQFQTGMMLGRVLELSEHTASTVAIIEARQTAIIQRIDRLEQAPPANTSISKVLLAGGAAVAGLLANIKAETVGDAVATLIRGLSH